VNSNEEALKKFAKAGHDDCYRSLYPCLQEQDGQTFLVPDVLYIDQDDRSKKDFVIGRIEQVFGGNASLRC
jgi:hypothetical protein